MSLSPLAFQVCNGSEGFFGSFAKESLYTVGIPSLSPFLHCLYWPPLRFTPAVELAALSLFTFSHNPSTIRWTSGVMIQLSISSFVISGKANWRSRTNCKICTIAGEFFVKGNNWLIVLPFYIRKKTTRYQLFCFKAIEDWGVLREEKRTGVHLVKVEQKPEYRVWVLESS